MQHDKWVKEVQKYSKSLEKENLANRIRKYALSIDKGFFVWGLILTVFGAIFAVMGIGIPMLVVGIILLIVRPVQVMIWESLAQLLDNTDKLVYLASKTASKNDPEE